MEYYKKANIFDAKFIEVETEMDVCPIVDGYRMMYADELADPNLFEQI
jgi:hypothetical protein